MFRKKGFLPAVRGRGHEHDARGATHEAAKLVVGLRGEGHPMGFVDHDDVPASSVGADRLLDHGVYRRQIERGDPQVVVDRQSTLTDGGCGDPPQAAAKEPREVGSPLLHEMGRTDDQTPLDESKPLHLAEIHASHDRFARTGFICEQEPQPWLGQHGPVDGVRLVGYGRRGAVASIVAFDSRVAARIHSAQRPASTTAGSAAPSLGVARCRSWTPSSLKGLDLHDSQGGSRTRPASPGE